MFRMYGSDAQSQRAECRRFLALHDLSLPTDFNTTETLKDFMFLSVAACTAEREHPNKQNVLDVLCRLLCQPISIEEFRNFFPDTPNFVLFFRKYFPTEVEISNEHTDPEFRVISLPPYDSVHPVLAHDVIDTLERAFTAKKARDDLVKRKKNENSLKPENLRLYINHYNVLYDLMSKYNAMHGNPITEPINSSVLTEILKSHKVILTKDWLKANLGRSSFKKLVESEAYSWFSKNVIYDATDQGFFHLALSGEAKRYEPHEIDEMVRNLGFVEEKPANIFGRQTKPKAVPIPAFLGENVFNLASSAAQSEAFKRPLRPQTPPRRNAEVNRQIILHTDVMYSTDEDSSSENAESPKNTQHSVQSTSRNEMCRRREMPHLESSSEEESDSEVQQTSQRRISPERMRQSSLKTKTYSGPSFNQFSEIKFEPLKQRQMRQISSDNDYKSDRSRTAGRQIDLKEARKSKSKVAAVDSDFSDMDQRQIRRQISPERSREALRDRSKLHQDQDQGHIRRQISPERSREALRDRSKLHKEQRSIINDKNVEDRNWRSFTSRCETPNIDAGVKQTSKLTSNEPATSSQTSERNFKQPDALPSNLRSTLHNASAPQYQNAFTMPTYQLMNPGQAPAVPPLLCNVYQPQALITTAPLPVYMQQPQYYFQPVQILPHTNNAVPQQFLHLMMSGQAFPQNIAVGAIPIIQSQSRAQMRNPEQEPTPTRSDNLLVNNCVKTLDDYLVHGIFWCLMNAHISQLEYLSLDELEVRLQYLFPNTLQEMLDARVCSLYMFVVNNCFFADVINIHSNKEKGFRLKSAYYRKRP